MNGKLNEWFEVLSKKLHLKIIVLVSTSPRLLKKYGSTMTYTAGIVRLCAPDYAPQ
jgi:hypothetical protein